MKKIELGNCDRAVGYRDATHIAVIAVKVPTGFVAGERVGLKDGVVCKPNDASPALGILDPFGWVGDVAWLCLDPGETYDLRHVYLHRELDKDGDRMTLAKSRMEQFAEELGSDVEEVLGHADSYQRWGDYWSECGRFEGKGIYEEFWDDYTILTGKEVSDDGEFLSCSC